MTVGLYHKRLERALDRQGGLWALNDILERIADGRMQHFVRNNSWVVTQISVFPRRRVLEVVAAVGDLGDCRILHGQVLAYAKELGVDLVAAYGRKGWARDADRNGWKLKTTSYLYHKEL